MNSFIKPFNELTLNELYSILKLRVDVFVVEQNCPYPELDGKDKDAYHLFFKEDDDNMASYLRIITNETAIRIGRVVTHSNYRSKGLSSKLMQIAMEYIASKFSDKEIMLSAQDHLQHFYAKFGFVAVSSMYLEDGIPHVDMEFRT